MGLAGETLTEMGELAEAGCVAFSQADVPLADTQVLLRAMQYAATFGYRVWLRPQDRASRRAAASRTTARSRRASGLPAFRRSPRRSRSATILALVRDTGVARAPVPAVDGRAAWRWCAPRRREGLPVTCDVGVHHLHLCDVDIG